MAAIEEKKYTSVDFPTAFALSDELQKTASELQGSIDPAVSQSDFKALSSKDLCGSFPKNFDDSIKNLIESINTAITQTNTFLKELKDTDDKIAGLFDPSSQENGSSSPKPTYTPTGGGPSKKPDKEKETESGTQQGTESGTEQGTEAGVDNTQQQMDKFKQLSLSDLNEVTATLMNYAKEKNMTIDALLSDKAYSDKIKEILLKNTKIPQEFRTLIEQGKSECIITALKNILSAENNLVIGLDTDTSMVVKSMLERIAAENNISVDKLFSGDKVSDVVKKGLESMGAILNATKNYKVEDVQENMLSIYDGSDVTVDNTTMNSIRDQIDAISQKTTISYNELLETEDYRDLMAKSMGRLQRTSWFLSTLSKCSDSAITGALKNILNFKRS